MRRCVLSIFAACVLSGCVSVGPPGTPIALTGVQIRQAQEGLKARLKDPMSAMFPGNTFGARAANGDVTVCGLVNAKNSFGGYTGASPYIATLRSGIVIDAAIEDGEYNIIVGFCRQRGVPI